MPCDDRSRPGVPQSDASTSRSLLAALNEEEPEAWDRLVSLYTPLVYQWLRKLGVAEQDMADVIQEVFGSVAANVHRFRRDRPGDTFRGWLRTITRNKVYDLYRRQGREPKPVGGTEAQIRFSQIPLLEPNEADQSESQASDHLLQRALEFIRGRFEERTWQAFWRVVIDGRTPKEVAEELSMRPGAVRVAKSRVLRRLRQEIGELH
jgi:RNA polymerase sigma-70 factor (ECF subfamily)